MILCDRRRFLQTAAAGIAVVGAIDEKHASAEPAQTSPSGPRRPRRVPQGRLNKQDVRHFLTGPLASISTPFDRDGNIDVPALRQFIDFAIDAGSRSVILTAGDSHFFCLSDQELAELTKITCAHAAGRAMVVAADLQFSTRRAVEFAQFARSLGASVLMCTPPDWGASATVDTLADHYAEVAKHLPVMIVTAPFISRGADFGLKTIKLALDRSEGVVAIKDDFCGEFAHRLGTLAHERCAIFSGGQKENHLNMWPYGCDGYMSTFITIAPQIAHRYWAAIEKRDIAAARKIVTEIDMPFFKYILGAQGGFDAAMHGVRELYGIGKRWRRKPYYSLSDAEMDQIRAFLATLPIPRPPN